MKKIMFFIMLFLLSMFGVCFAEIIGTEQAKEITGIVIDTRGMGLQKAISPIIYDKDGEIVNNIIPTDINWLTRNGTVDYYDSETLKEVLDGKSRAGGNYILIKAVEIKDFNVNPVISIDDAENLRHLPEFNNILKKANIVIIK